MEFDIKKFSYDVYFHRVITLRTSMEKASKQIGISKATMSRMENGHIPDVATFAKILTWLGSEPNKYFE